MSEAQLFGGIAWAAVFAFLAVAEWPLSRAQAILLIATAAVAGASIWGAR
jgi:hypothetical protein